MSAAPSRRCAVARALDLDRVLARLRQLARMRRRAWRAGAEALKDPRRGQRRDRRGRACRRRQAVRGSGRRHPAGRRRRTALPRYAARPGISLRLSMKRSTESSRWRMAKLSGSGVCGTSPPRMLSSHAIEFGSGQHGGVRARLAEARGDARGVSIRRSRRQSVALAVPPARVAAAAGPSRPNRPRCRRSRTSLPPALSAAARIALDLAEGMQPRIVAEHLARFQRPLDPGRRRLVADMAMLKELAVDLGRGLERVAAVDENRGCVRPARSPARPSR